MRSTVCLDDIFGLMSMEIADLIISQTNGQTTDVIVHIKVRNHKTTIL